MPLRLDYLNHASMLLTVGGVRVLSDPWFEGTCFSDGWGLRYLNPDAHALAATATHLWISHWHSDHLHAPTLSKLAEANPDMEVLANVSANFSMLERMRGLGFRNVVPLGERRPLSIGDGVEVTRYPTAGIDNALLLRAPGWTVLNYNDCNLPAAAVRALGRHMGPIDVLLTNYNHAGKLIGSDDVPNQKDWRWEKLARAVDLIDPDHVVPFASSHYYRVPASRNQNATLLSFDELAERSAGDPRYCVLRVGDGAELAAPGATPVVTRREPALEMQPEDAIDYGKSVPWDRLVEAVGARCAQIRRGFPGVARLLGPLRVELTDLGRVMAIDAARGGRDAGGAAPHIGMHSVALHDWFGRRFGDDTFTAGAHYDVLDRDTRQIERWTLLSLLEASHLSIRDALGYLTSREGLWFLWSRREEALSTVLSGQVRAGQARLD